MTVLLMGTSPRSTWVTAPDLEVAERVRELLGDSCLPVSRHGVLDPNAVDIGIGVEAYAAAGQLLEAGYTFDWHEDQHPLNREPGCAWGIPVTT